MGISEERRHPANTQEFVAMWSAAKEEHFVQELAPMLPVLLGSPENLEPTRVRETARHLVTAMRLAAAPEGGVHAAVEYLAQVTGVTREPSAST